MKIAIVGHEKAKFTSEAEEEARYVIRKILTNESLLSFFPLALLPGACHLGGVDIWAEEEAKKLELSTIIFPPKSYSWSLGYRPRNIQIAKACDRIHVIVVDKYPPDWNGMVFDRCYHCGTSEHVKSGACWTANYAVHLQKVAYWHIIHNEEKDL